MRERARYGPVEVQNGIAKKQLLSTLKIICKYVYDDIFAAISLKQAFWRARHLKYLTTFQSMLCPSRTVVEGLDKGLARINTALETSSYFII